MRAQEWRDHVKSAQACGYQMNEADRPKVLLGGVVSARVTDDGYIETSALLLDGEEGLRLAAWLVRTVGRRNGDRR